jgi:hypothetical protein
MHWTIVLDWIGFIIFNVWNVIVSCRPLPLNRVYPGSELYKPTKAPLVPLEMNAETGGLPKPATDGCPGYVVRFAKRGSATNASRRSKARLLNLNTPTACPPHTVARVNTPAWFAATTARKFVLSAT